MNGLSPAVANAYAGKLRALNAGTPPISAQANHLQPGGKLAVFGLGMTPGSQNPVSVAVAAVVPLSQRCPFGSACWRRNPHHIATQHQPGHTPAPRPALALAPAPVPASTQGGGAGVLLFCHDNMGIHIVMVLEGLGSAVGMLGLPYGGQDHGKTLDETARDEFMQETANLLRLNQSALVRMIRLMHSRHHNQMVLVAGVNAWNVPMPAMFNGNKQILAANNASPSWQETTGLVLVPLHDIHQALTTHGGGNLILPSRQIVRKRDVDFIRSALQQGLYRTAPMLQMQHPYVTQHSRYAPLIGTTTIVME